MTLNLADAPEVVASELARHFKGRRWDRLFARMKALNAAKQKRARDRR
jgi:hypothetical protein